MVSKAPLFIISVGIIALVLLFFVTGSGGTGLGIGDKGTVTCQVKVDTDIFSAPDIEKQPKCQRTGDNCFFSINTQAIFTEKVRVELIAGGNVFGTETVKLTKGTGKDIKLNGCVPKNINSGTIQLVNDEGGITDSKAVSW